MAIIGFDLGEIWIAPRPAASSTTFPAIHNPLPVQTLVFKTAIETVPEQGRTL